MALGFVEKTKGFLLNPTETFNEIKEEPMGNALKYFVMWLVIYSVLFSIIIALVGGMLSSLIPGYETLMMGAGAMAAVFSFIMLLISGIIGIFIGAGIIHLGVLLVGGKQGYRQTLKAMAYGGTPGYVLGWIPILNFIVGIWALIVGILGIRELQEVSTGRAVIAVILPAIIIGIIVGVLATTFVFFSGMMPSIS